MRLCDVHQHVVYGVDDGSPDFKTSQIMLRKAHEQGIIDIICTSHSRAVGPPFPKEQYLRALSRLREWSEQEIPGLRLYTGSEILYSEDILPLLKAGELLTLADTKYILVEFLPDMPIEILLRAASDFLNAGYKPVFAHVERYECLREKNNFDRLRAEPVLLQMNASTVIRCKKLFCDRWAKKMLADDCIDIVASDAHNTDTRAQKLGEAYVVLKQLWGQGKAERLCSTVPRLLVGIY